MDYHHHARVTLLGREVLAKSVMEGRLSLRDRPVPRHQPQPGAQAYPDTHLHTAYQR